MCMFAGPDGQDDDAGMSINVELNGNSVASKQCEPNYGLTCINTTMYAPNDNSYVQVSNLSQISLADL